MKFRFPYNGWLDAGKQSRKAEQAKMKFGVRNSVYLVPNEAPEFEYTIRTFPQLFSKVDYKIQLECDVIDPSAPIEYIIKFNAVQLPSSASIVLKLIGTTDVSDFVRLSGHSSIFRFNERDIGRVNDLFENFFKHNGDLHDCFS